MIKELKKPCLPWRVGTGFQETFMFNLLVILAATSVVDALERWHDHRLRG